MTQPNSKIEGLITSPSYADSSQREDDIRQRNIRNLVGNYARATYVRNIKLQVGEHAKDFKVWVKPDVEDCIDKNYIVNLNNYVQVM